jgi:hypothetical protein
MVGLIAMQNAADVDTSAALVVVVGDLGSGGCLL